VSAKKKATKARIKTKATTLPSSPEAQVSFADHPDPPSGFTFLLACIAGCRADEVIGDANEQYYKLVARMGIEKGRWWYRVYVVKTFAGRVPGLVMRIALLHKLLGLFTSIS
jgi:hypothetical protein